MADQIRRHPCKSSLTLAVGSLLATGTLQAAVITVDTNTDGPVGSTPGCSLRAAVASANAGISYDDCTAGSVYADQIEFDSGLSFSTITLSEGEIEITKALTITGPVPTDPAGIVLDANSASRIFNIQGNDPSEFEVVLDSLTLTGGRTSKSQERGGAINAYNADVRLDAALLTGNSTEGMSAWGGGLSVQFGQATLVVSIVSGNTTTGAFAAGAGVGVIDGEIILSGSTISGNSTSGYGAYGGGLRVLRGHLTLTDSTVAGNSTAQGYASGGGIFVLLGGATVNGSTISGNSTAGYSAYAGGMYVSGGDLIVSNSTVSSNSTAGKGAYGGGLFSRNNVILTNTTVANNTAQFGASGIHLGPFSAANLTLNNSLIVQSDPDETACDEQADTVINSLITDASCTGTATDLADISLGPLADNGGPTLTHALGAASVARNAAGDCEDDFGVSADQRGEQRPGAFSTACDIGAFEYQGSEELFIDRFEAQ